MPRLLRRTGLLALLALFSLSLGCASDRMVIDNANQMHGQLQPAVMEDPVLSGYVQTLGDRVIAVARELDRSDPGSKGHTSGENNQWMFSGIRFHLVNSKTLNAFTTGGKHVYLYTELFRSCKTEDEFAAVVAHEYAHIYCRHVHNSYNRAITVQAVALGAALAASQIEDQSLALGIAGLAVVGGQLVALDFNREDEDEADAEGFRFYVRAGWDPQQFAGFFQTMIDQGNDSGPVILSSHPSLSSRVEKARKRAAALPPVARQWQSRNTASPRQFQLLQARAEQVGRTMPTDESLEQAQTLLAAFPSCVSPQQTPEQLRARDQLLLNYGTPEQQQAVKQQQARRQQPRAKRRPDE